MPAIVISAVNTGTDTLTATAHGLLTGDRCRVRNVGGALPTGLTGAVDVFAIRVDANDLKVATSSSNAQAGTAINITGAGSGTNTIEFGLPYCIPTALAAAGTQVKSADANGTWNALVALYALLTGQAQAIWAAVTVAVAWTFNALVTFAAGLVVPTGQHITLQGTSEVKHGDRKLDLPPYAMMSTTATPNTGNVALGTADAYLGIPLVEGDRLKSIAVSVAGNGTADVDIILHVNGATGTQATPSSGSATVTNPGSMAVTTINPTDTVLGAGETFRLQFTPNATGVLVGNVCVTYDRP